MCLSLSVTSVIIISMSYEYVLDVCAGSTEVQKIISFHFFYFLPVWGKFENFLWFCVLCKTSGRAETSENSAIIIIYTVLYLHRSTGRRSPGKSASFLLAKIVQ